MLLRSILAMTILLVLVQIAPGQNTWHVQVGAVPPGTGSTGSPFPTIAAGIAAAVPGDTVLVGPGVYAAPISLAGKAITLRSSGGAAATQIEGSSTTPCIEANGIMPVAATIEGFRIQNGLGSLANEGGGITAHLSRLVLRDLHFVNCVGAGTAASTTVSGPGGGVHSDSGNLLVEGCVFESCGGGAGMNAAALAQAPGPGGAAAIELGCGTLVVIDCRFSQGMGGPGGNSFISGVFSFPPGTGGAGAIHAMEASVNIDRCVFSGNVGGPPGLPIPSGPPFGNAGAGAVHVATAAFLPVAVFDSVFFANVSSPGATGALFLQGAFSSPFTIVGHCSFHANASAAIAISLTGSSSVRNCICWGNGSPEIIVANFQMALSVTFSDVQGGYAGGGVGNINVDPQFVAPGSGDLRLKATSPCLNAGTTPSTTMDFEGDPRVVYTASDMGADEFAFANFSANLAGNVGVGVGVGSPFEPLRVAGSTGAATREIHLVPGSTTSLQMLQPPFAMTPRPFAIFGLLGAARLQDAFMLPFGIGTMAFPPCEAVPGLQPLVFTVAWSFGPPPGCFSVLPSTPTPWTSPMIAVTPYPLTVTLQGVIEESPGLFSVTNGIIVATP